MRKTKKIPIAFPKLKIGIIGFGNIASGLAGGMVKKKLALPSQFMVYDIHHVRNDIAKNKFKFRVAKNYKDLCQNSELILLAVKPQNTSECLRRLKGLIKQHHLIISTITGVRTKDYQRVLGSKTRVIRTMPNTPVLIALGATVYFANKNCSDHDKHICERIFKSLGIIFETKKEIMLNAVTAISGSGPAFVYTYAHSVIESAVKLGLPRPLATELVYQTLIGATRMMSQMPIPVEDLIKQVTSKKGTTLAGLRVLHRKNFAKVIHSCMSAATRRAKQLSKVPVNNH
ncbi:MAG: Pyrroline-5-carboxylate reductase [uncultured bacterium]|nr:MAG: Pyrroline-5-carboxylate reductase [uncultured bacterium]